MKYCQRRRWTTGRRNSIMVFSRRRVEPTPGEQEIKIIYTFYIYSYTIHTHSCTRTCVCARHTMRTDLNVVRDGWPSLPPPPLPYPLLPRTDYHYIILIFTDCRVCGQKNGGSPLTPTRTPRPSLATSVEHLIKIFLCILCTYLDYGFLIHNIYII